MMDAEPVILIVGEGSVLGPCLRTMGFHPVVVRAPHDALMTVEARSPALLLVNLPSGALDPESLREVYRFGIPILLLADPADRQRKLEDLRGRVRILSRPVSEADLRTAVREALAGPGAGGSDGRPADGSSGDPYLREYAPLFGNSRKMRAIKEIIEEVAGTSAAVLVRGESGVGKEVVARAIHAASTRHAQAFVKVNCAALPAELLESELFGHEKGAFTGAYRRKLGKFEFANKGTIFLDEIGELPRALQAKLLHVLQDLEFFRIGGREVIRVDTRVIAATNRNLEAALESAEFREDLYYRLNVVEIRVPPLRERREEIPILASSLLTRFNQEYHRNVGLSPETMTIFQGYSWPGNIRELDNVIRRLVLLGNPRQIHEELGSSARASSLRNPDREDPVVELPASPAGATLTLGLREIARRAALEAERKALAEVLDRVHWNRTEAARILKVSYKTLLNKITECGLTRGRPRSQS